MTYASTVNYSETISASVPAISSNNNTVQHTGYSTSKSLTGTVTTGQPVITDGALFTKTLSAGAGTIDLTSLTGTNGRSITLSGLKVQVMKFLNVSTNGTNMVVGKGASNGFGLGSGGTTWSMVIPPGCEFTWYGNEGTPDVSGSVKTIDITGGTTEVLQCVIIGG
jgi:hypothetical protein